MDSKQNLKLRLIVMNFLIFAVWGAYLCSLGIYLGRVGMGAKIGSFFAVQGIISLFMPALMGIVADRWVPAQKLLGICHFLSAIFMAIAGFMGMKYGDSITFGQIFPWYTLGVAFFMPTIALGNSVSYNALTKAGMDTVKDFPPIRVFGTIGFILSMWIVNFTGFKNNYNQLFVSAGWGIILAFYAFTLPDCPVNRERKSASLVDAFGLRAFALFKDSKMCVFFIFSFLLGMCLQVTNGFATPYLDDFGRLPEYADAFAVKNNVFLSSISQAMMADSTTRSPQTAFITVTKSGTPWMTETSMHLTPLGTGNPQSAMTKYSVWPRADNSFRISGFSKPLFFITRPSQHLL